MSKQIKIFLIVGIILIVVVGAYWLWPSGEPDAQQRGVSTDNLEQTE